MNYNFVGVMGVYIENCVESFSIFRTFVDLFAIPIDGKGERLLNLLRQTQEGKALAAKNVSLTFPMPVQIERNCAFDSGVSNVSFTICMIKSQSVTITFPLHWCRAVSYVLQTGLTLEDTLCTSRPRRQEVKRFVFKFRARIDCAYERVHVEYNELHQSELLFVWV
jgi:hypothetical protein